MGELTCARVIIAIITISVVLKYVECVNSKFIWSCRRMGEDSQLTVWQELEDFISFVSKIKNINRFTLVHNGYDYDSNTLVKIHMDMSERSILLQTAAWEDFSRLKKSNAKDAVVAIGKVKYVGSMNYFKLLSTLVEPSSPLYLVISDNNMTTDWLYSLASEVPYDREFYVVYLSSAKRENRGGHVHELYSIGESVSTVRIAGRKFQRASSHEQHTMSNCWATYNYGSIWQRRKDLKNVTFLAAASREFYLDEKNPLYQDMDPTDLVAARVWKELMAQLNFNLRILPPRLTVDGAVLDDGSKSGGRIAPVVATLMNSQSMVNTRGTFTVKNTIVRGSYHLIFRRPRRVYDIQWLLAPFDTDMWLAIACMGFLILPACLWILLRWSPNDSSEAYLIPIRCVTFQGLGMKLTRWSARVGCFTCLVTGYVLINTYMCSMKSALLAGNVSLPFHSLEDYFSRESQYMLLYDVSALKDVLDTHKWGNSSALMSLVNPGRMKMEGKTRNLLPYRERRYAANLLCSHDHAVLFTTPDAFHGLFDCEVVVLPKRYFTVSEGIGARADWPFYRLLCSFVHLMREYGVFTHSINHKKLYKAKNLRTDFDIIGVEHVKPILDAYLQVGIQISVLVFILEMLVCQAIKRCRNVNSLAMNRGKTTQNSQLLNV